MAFTASMVVTQRRERERRESRARDELEHREERASHADSLDAEGGLAGSAGGHGYKPSSIMTKRKRRAQPHPFADKDLRVAEVEQGDVLVPIRMALEHLETREGSRGLVLFALFFSMYFCHTSEALDAPQGRKTLKWYADAIKSKYDLTATDENGFCAVTDFGFECYTPFVERNSVEEVLEFLEHDLGIVMRGIKEFCPTCLIGITAVNRDLRILSLGQMICSDFYFNVKTIGDLTSSDFKQFPDRNCTSGDEKWSKNPIVASAPCCDSVQLGLASLTLLALNGIEPTPSSSLGNLQNEMVRKKRTRPLCASSNRRERGDYPASGPDPRRACSGHCLYRQLEAEGVLAGSGGDDSDVLVLFFPTLLAVSHCRVRILRVLYDSRGV
mmetsp:Transcript_27181/g.67031  ORF Transcript_27181/g.67031 Transcript_27181/m.67031 type:complete len:385 (+) Transcript_27181:188-1342(+)